MTPETFGITFHLALRRNSDTEWSGILWNLISILPGDDCWSEFYEYGAEKMNKERWSIFRIVCEWKPSKHTYHSSLFSQSLRKCDVETLFDVQRAFEALEATP